MSSSQAYGRHQPPGGTAGPSATRAEHAFCLFGFPLLTLQYRISRKPTP